MGPTSVCRRRMVAILITVLVALTIVVCVTELFNRALFSVSAVAKVPDAGHNEGRFVLDLLVSRGFVDVDHVVHKTVRHVSFGPQLEYVVRWYGCSKADDTAMPPVHTPQYFIDTYWRQFDKRRKLNGLSGVNYRSAISSSTPPQRAFL